MDQKAVETTARALSGSTTSESSRTSSLSEMLYHIGDCPGDRCDVFGTRTPLEPASRLLKRHLIASSMSKQY